MGFTAYYPPAYSSTYVKATSEEITPWEAFTATDPTTSLTGASVGNEWNTVDNYPAPPDPQKFNVDLGEAKVVNAVRINNAHYEGGFVDLGIKTTRIYGTNSAAAFANTTYADLTDLTLLSADPITVATHVLADQADYQYFGFHNTTAYRYYVVRIEDNHDPINWGNIGLRRIEFGYQDLPLGLIEVDGAGGGVGSLVTQAVEAAAAGGGTATLSLQSVEVAGVGGGVGVLTFNNITIAGTGETSVLTDVGGSLPYEASSGITLWSHVAASVGGQLGYSLASEIIIDVISVSGELPYSVSSGIAAHSQNDTVIAGVLGYSLTSGVEAHSHIAVSVGGALAYELTSGITADRDLGVTVGGELPYSLASGISAWPSPQVDVGGELAYVLTSGIEASGGDSCSGALVYVRYPVR